MSRRSRLHYHLAAIGYWASRMNARLPRTDGLLGDSLSFGAAVRYKLPSHTTSRQNRPEKTTTVLVSIRATAFRSWLPPIGPIKDFHLQSLRHARRKFALANKVCQWHTNSDSKSFFRNQNSCSPSTSIARHPEPSFGSLFVPLASFVCQ